MRKALIAIIFSLNMCTMEMTGEGVDNKHTVLSNELIL